MKTTKSLFQRLFLAAGSLLMSASLSLAADGGGAGVAGGAAAGGGGHGGGAIGSAGGGHGGSTGSGAGHAAGGFSAAGFHSQGLSTSGFHSSFGSGATSIGHYSGNSFGGGISRGGLSSSNFNGGSTSFAAQRSSFGQSAARTQAPAARVNNAWSDPYTSPRASNIGTAQSATAGANRNGNFANRGTGQFLRPGAAGYNATVANNARGNRGGRFGNGGSGHRYYNNNFPYFVYYPFLYNNFGYGGYDGGYGGFNGDFAGTTDYAGLSDDAIANASLPTYGNNPNYYYNDDTLTPATNQQNNDPQAAPAQALPDASDVGPQNPNPASATSQNPSKGPDSLVEAVQNELARRGYFEGNADAMYSEATKEAIRRFQTDQHLPATGRINEATLHALRLD